MMSVMMRRFGLSLLLVGLGCESGSTGAPPSDVKAPSAAAPRVAEPPAKAAAAPGATAGGAGTPRAFGASFEPGPEVGLATLLANPSAYADKTVTTSGKVQRACSNKGCWMEIGEGDDACRVTFKDYGFFVPTDSAGAQARVQGRLQTQKVPAGRVAHLESEGARFRNKQADGSATEVQLVATAVELVR